MRAVSFGIGKTGFAGRASLAARPAAIPDVDHPRGRQEELVSDPRDGAASQPAVAISPRDRDLLVAAYRVFADETYVSQIATAVSFDRGRHWERSVPSRARQPPTRRSASTPTATRC